jgi:hypothetical protein
MQKNTKEEWIGLLQRHLNKHFDKHDDSYISKYKTYDYLVITIVTKASVRKRSYTFGGPVKPAIVDFFDPNELSIVFLSSHKPVKIPWQKVNEIILHFHLTRIGDGST